MVCQSGVDGACQHDDDETAKHRTEEVAVDELTSRSFLLANQELHLFAMSLRGRVRAPIIPERWADPAPLYTLAPLNTGRTRK